MTGRTSGINVEGDVARIESNKSMLWSKGFKMVLSGVDEEGVVVYDQNRCGETGDPEKEGYANYTP